MQFGYDLTIWENEKVKFPIRLPQNTWINGMFCGSSGSGKSTELLYVIASIDEPCDIMFFDFKGEYPELQHCENYRSGDEVITGLEEYYAEFQRIRRKEVVQQRQRLCIIEEYPAVVQYAGKSAIRTNVQEMLMLGRGVGQGNGTWIVAQRPDSALFPGGAKLNMHFIVAMGFMNQVDWSVCFPGTESPMRNFQTGHGMIWADGKGEARPLIVPYIRDKQLLLRKVENHLNGIW